MKHGTAPARIATLLALILIGGLARAKPASPPPAAGGPHAREKLEALRIWRLTEELNLTEDQSAQFFPKLKKLRQLREERRDNRRALIDELTKELAKDSSATPRLKQLLDSLQTVDDNYRDSERKVRREISQILTVQQQVRLLLFQETFERQTRHVIKQIERGRERR